MSELCNTCHKSTTPEKRIVVTCPDGKIEYYCNKCSKERTDKLNPNKRKHSYERK